MESCIRQGRDGNLIRAPYLTPAHYGPHDRSRYSTVTFTRPSGRTRAGRYRKPRIAVVRPRPSFLARFLTATTSAARLAINLARGPVNRGCGFPIPAARTSTLLGGGAAAAKGPGSITPTRIHVIIIKSVPEGSGKGGADTAAGMPVNKTPTDADR